MSDRASCNRVPPHTQAVTILVADELVPTVIGRPVFCSHFKLDRREDGFYELTVTQDVDDNFMDFAEWQFNG